MVRGNYSKITNVGVDLDGVISNFSEAFSKQANAIFGERCPLITADTIIEHWDWYKWYPITKEEQEIVWDYIVETENFWMTTQLINKTHFYRFMRMFSTNPLVNVYFVTARQPTKGMTVAQQSIEWLARLGWPNPQVIEIFDKGPALQALKIHHFLDDKAENILDALKNSSAECYIFEAKHNHKLECMLKENFNGQLDHVQNRYQRVQNLDAFSNIIYKKVAEKVMEKV